MSERRRFPRRRVESLVYVSLDQGNGGILLDISEGGFRLQGAHPLMSDQVSRLQFRLPQTLRPLEASGEIVWTDDSGKMGGVRFVGSTEGRDEQIKEWVSLGATSGYAPAETAVQVASSAPAAVTDAGAGEIAAEIVAALYDESLDAFAPHHWMRRFQVFRQEQSYRQMQQFSNTPEAFQHVFGNFDSRHEHVLITYR